MPEREGESEPLQVESLVDEIDQQPSQSERDKKDQKEREQKDPRGQVVDIAQPAIEQRPDQAKFVSEYDSSVLREMKGQVGRDKAGAQVAPQPPTPAIPPMPPSKLLPGDPRAAPPKSSLVALRGPSGDKVPGPVGPATEVRSLGPDGTLAHAAGPVSYTHLDVYKRQKQRLASKRRTCGRPLRPSRASRFRSS